LVVLMIEMIEEIIPRIRLALPTPDILSVLELIGVRNEYCKF
jgi:hypothetical protein